MPGTLASGNPKLSAVADVDIDNNGKFKYILCKVFDTEKPAESKLIVRGTGRAEFHCKYGIINPGNQNFINWGGPVAMFSSKYQAHPQKCLKTKSYVVFSIQTVK